MSLLSAASAMTGDIWSTGAFSFESPLKDLLDSGDYTMEQLLAEDELLQELRGIHPILTTYFSSEKSVTQLLKYVTMAPPKSSTGNKNKDTAESKESNNNKQPETPVNGNKEKDPPTYSPPAPATPVSPDDAAPTSPDVTSKTTTIATDDGGVELAAREEEEEEENKQEKEQRLAAAVKAPEEEEEEEPGKWLLAQLEKKISLEGNSNDIDDADGKNNSDTSASGKTKHPEEDPELLYIRFPFMACEIICCEIEGVIETLVEGRAAVVVQDDDDEGDDDVVKKQQQQKSTTSSPAPPPVVVKPRKKITTTSEAETDCPDGSVGVEVLQVEQPASPRSPDSSQKSATEKKDEDDEEDDNENDVPPPRLLDLLFGVLVDTRAGELDDYRAGYFDKILTVLFRKRPAAMRDYINTGGSMYGKHLLMQCMMRHLYSQSIMQIAQRLLLPPRPTATAVVGTGNEIGEGDEEGGDGERGENAGDDGSDNPDAVAAVGGEGDGAEGEGGQDILTGEEDDEEGENGAGIKCDWSKSTEALNLLLERLLDPDGSEGMSDADKLPTLENKELYEEQRLAMSLNASEVLITIIQNSMLSSETMLMLTSVETLERLSKAATTLLGEEEYFSPHESLLTSAMNVIESLILQLGGYGAVGTMAILTPEEEEAAAAAAAEAAQQDDGGVEAVMPPSPAISSSSSNDDQAAASATPLPEDNDDADATGGDAPLIADLTNLLAALPEMLAGFSKLLRHPSTASWTSAMQFSQNKQSVQLLGTSRLRIVRVLESLVLLGDPSVDSVLVQSDCLKTCLELFWEFPWCSMLHQSVANLLVHVFEGQNVRFEIQEYFLDQCNLMGRLMDSFVESIDDANISGTGAATPPAAAGDDDDGAEQPQLRSASTSAARKGDDSGDGEDANKVVSSVVMDLEKAVSNANATSAMAKAALAALMTPDAAAALRAAEEDAEEAAAAAADRLPVSEDDVDAALEQQQEAAAAAAASTRDDDVEMASTEAVQQESQDGMSEAALIETPAQSFRLGYMGHVIIICQALVQACSNEWGPDPSNDDMTQQSGETGESNGRGFKRASSSGVSEASASAGEMTEDTGDLETLLIADLVRDHELTDRWQEFVATTLSSEIAIQSTPLGGMPSIADTPMMQDPLSQSLGGLDAPIAGGRRPGLADDDDDLIGSGAAPPPPPRGIYGGGDIIDMDDNDLEVAANMMAGLGLSNLRRQAPKSASLDGKLGGDNDDANSGEFSGSGDSEKSYNSGETASEKGYLFDDPLGKAGGLGIELGKLTQYKADDDSDEGVRGKDDDDDGNSSSSSSQEPPRKDESDDDDDEEDNVPVMDLFAGNFHDAGQASPGDSQPNNDGVAFDFANFASAFEDSVDAGGAGSLNDSTAVLADHSGGGDDSETSAKSAEIEAIFGEGDHSSLLEEDITEGPAVEASTIAEETPETSSPIGESAVTEPERRTDSSAEIESEREQSPQQPEESRKGEMETMSVPTKGQTSPSFHIPDIPTAPSDELQADANSITALSPTEQMPRLNSSTSREDSAPAADPAASGEAKPEAPEEEPAVVEAEALGDVPSSSSESGPAADDEPQ